MPWYILDLVTTLGDVNLCSKAYLFQSSRYLWNANTVGHSWLGNVIKYSLYYLTWRSLCSSGLVMISFTIAIHPYVSHTYKNSISRRYSQNWWAAKVVSSHFSAYIESIYYVMREASSLQYYQTSCQPERIAPRIVLTEKTLQFKEGIWQTFFSCL